MLQKRAMRIIVGEVFLEGEQRREGDGSRSVGRESDGETDNRNDTEEAEDTHAGTVRFLRLYFEFRFDSGFLSISGFARP